MASIVRRTRLLRGVKHPSMQPRRDRRTFHPWRGHYVKGRLYARFPFGSAAVPDGPDPGRCRARIGASVQRSNAKASLPVMTNKLVKVSAPELVPAVTAPTREEAEAAVRTLLRW